jgi:hypothetical protein
MKKILSWVIILVVVSLLTEPVMGTVNTIIEQNKIDDCKPSQQERLDFQALLNDNTYFYYNNLNDREKEAYVTMYSSFMNFEDSVVMEIDGKALKSVFTAVLYDNPHIFWIANDYQYIENNASVTFTPSYRKTSAEAQQITTLLNARVDKIITYANTLSTDYEKELYIHNYICENTAYDELLKQSGGDSAYDSLLYGKAICEGYSRAVQILLDAVDIDNYLVVGDGLSNGETAPHMWNVVEIDNLNYYLDATWNDSGADNSIVYLYFNVNDEMIKVDHFNIEPANNFCISDLSYYYAVENSYIKSYNGFSKYSDHSAEILKSGSNSVDFVFENSSDFKKALKDIENDNGFFNYVYSAVKKSGRRLNPYKVNYYTIDTHNYLCVVFEKD